MVVYILMTLIVLPYGVEHANTGWKLRPHLDSCFVIASMTSLLNPT
jgi:hypothetical protein